jgi:SAM-dependent methyltransferase
METNFFDQGSPYLAHPLLTPQRTAEEIDFILSILPVETGDRFLDIGCGFGRHSIELARRGFNVLGFDPSAAMIAAAKDRSLAHGSRPEFLQLRGEDLDVVNEFDAAICLFTTLGQVAGQKDNRNLLDSTCQALRPAGFLILEILQRDWAVNNLKPGERFGKGKNYTQVVRSYDPDHNIVTEKFTLVSPAEERLYVLQYHLFSRSEIILLLEGAGFAGLTFYDGYTANHLEPNSPTMVIRAQKPV